MVTETILDYIMFYHLGIKNLTFEPISMDSYLLSKHNMLTENL